MIHQLVGNLNSISSQALCTIGARHCWCIPPGDRKSEVRPSGRGLLHQMGGSRGIGKHSGRGCKEVCMKEYNDKTWGTRIPNVRQWVTV